MKQKYMIEKKKNNNSKHKQTKTKMSGVGFEPTPTYEDQKPHNLLWQVRYCLTILSLAP